MTRTRVRYDRIAALVISAALLVPLASGLLGTGANAGERDRTYTVQAGDTLWGIAREQDPGSPDPRELIFEIGRLNGLEGADIVPGQVLKLP